MPFFCISFRSWNAINLKRPRKETWKIHRTRGRCWKHSSAVRELQADNWQLPLPTWAELFWSHCSLPGVGDRVLPIASTLRCLRFPQCYKQRSSGRAASAGRTPRAEVLLGGQRSAGMGSALALEQGKATVLLHGNTEAKTQMLRLNLQPHPKVFFLHLINHESNLNRTIFLS